MQGVINKIKKWKGFEDFDGSNPNFLSKNPKYFSGYESCILSYAIENDDLEVVKYLIALGANVNLINEGTEQAPLDFIQEELENTSEIATALIEAGANIDYVCKVEGFTSDSFIGETALKSACQNNNLKLVKVLLKHNANINIQLNSPFDIPPICLLDTKKSNFGHIAKLLINHGANINDGNGELLRSAIIDEDVNAIENLINMGALSDIHLNCDNNPTALMFLVKNANSFYTDFEYIFLKLLKNVEDINAKDSNSKTVLHYIIEELVNGGDELEICFEKVVKIPSININSQDNDGNSPIVYLIQRTYEEYPPSQCHFPFIFHLTFLLKHGADPKIQNGLGKNSYNFAPDYSDKLEALLKTTPANLHFKHEAKISQARQLNKELEDTSITEIQDIIDKAQKEGYEYKVLEKKIFFVNNDGSSKIEFETLLRYSYKSINELLNNETEGEPKYLWLKKNNSKLFDNYELERRTKKYPNFLTLIFPKVFKSQQIQLLLFILDFYKNQFDNIGMEIITQKINDKLFENQKQLKVNLHKIKPQHFILSLIDSYSGDAVESGIYHVYRAALSPTGQSLLKVYQECLNEIVNLGFESKEVADKHLKQLKLNIKEVG